MAKALAPIISTAPGLVPGTVVVAIASGLVQADIFYTLDGSPPTASSTPYVSPFTLTKAATVNAIAIVQPSNVTSLAVSMPVPVPVGLVSTASWQTKPLASPQTGNYRLQFDATPGLAAMDGVMGFSPAPVSGYPGLSYGVRFSNAGTIDAMNGTGYTIGPKYTVGMKYHFTLDVTGTTYKASVTDSAGIVTVLGSGLPFRAAGPTISAFNYISEVGVVNIDAIPVASALAAPPPPPPPLKVTAALSWQPSTDPISGYNVYRGSAAGQENTKINTSLVTAPSFIDLNPPKGQDFYVVRTVITAPDGTDVESASSNEVSVTFA